MTLALALLLALPWVAVHELSHAFTGWLVGWDTVAMRPWPHRHKGKWLMGRWRYRMDTVGNLVVQDGWVSFAPFLVDWFVLTVWAVLLMSGIQAPAGNALALCAYVDASTNWVGLYGATAGDNDAWDVVEAFGLHLVVVRVALGAWLVQWPALWWVAG